jgi:hypothetical protein
MSAQTQLRRLWAGLLFLPLGLLLSGCGSSSLATVSGKVSYKGQPLKGGVVSIFPEKGGGAQRASIEADGTYKISKVPVGPAKITVDTSSLRPVPQKSLPGPYANAPKEALPKDLQGDPEHYVPIPDHYADPDKSGLTLDVKSGKNNHDIDLK